MDKWQTAKAYKKGVILDNNGYRYICISDHLSDPTNEPEVGSCWDVCWYRDSVFAEISSCSYGESMIDRLKRALTGKEIALPKPSSLPVHSHTDGGAKFKINTANISTGTVAGYIPIVISNDWKIRFMDTVFNSLNPRMFNIEKEEDRITIAYEDNYLVVTYVFETNLYQIIRMEGNNKEEELLFPAENLGLLGIYLKGGYKRIRDVLQPIQPRSSASNVMIGYQAGGYFSEVS